MDRTGRILLWLAVLPLFAFLLTTVVPVVLLWLFLRGVLLRVWFYLAHRVRGRDVLFVYSESPIWQTYIENNILPRLGNRAVVLNWSQRARWRLLSPWTAHAFRHWGGQREFNPMALVFAGYWRVQQIRFYRAFHDFKHGNDSALRRAESDLFAML